MQKRLIFDIETVGDDFDSLDPTTQAVLTRWVKKDAKDKDDGCLCSALEELKGGLGFSPLTGEIIVIGALDYERNKGIVYYQAPGEEIKEFEEGGITFKQATEKEMLESFWTNVKNYSEFISFNGRAFDVPFLMVRSARCGVKPTKDLMSNRYLDRQKFDSVHIDLLDQLSYQGTMRRKGSLHLWSRVFGIESPKAQGVCGEDVGRLFREKKFLDIARYNVHDLVATKEIYNYWNNYFRF